MFRGSQDDTFAQSPRVVARIRNLVGDDTPDPDRLAEIAVMLADLALAASWRDPTLRVARPGEELLYELDVAAGLPPLYLVSDGIGVTSPPHGHATWAVIAGIRGREVNRMFRVDAAAPRSVVESGQLIVGRGETLVLRPEDIHATAVAGDAATFHLHLYGRPLCELPSFPARCWETVELHQPTGT